MTPYRVAMRISTGIDAGVVRELTLMPVEGGRAITAVGLRSVQLGSLVYAALGLWADITDEPPGRETAPRMTARSSDTAVLLDRAVTEYRAARKRGSKRPTEEAARLLGYSRSHVGRLLVQARRQGLLRPARPGRAGEDTEEQQ